MNNYYVTWAIHISAETPLQAAEMALEMLKDPDMIATIFTVKSENSAITIDAVTGSIFPLEE